MFSRLNLGNARVLVTGASSGIGWSLAERLAEQKACLVLASRSQDRLETLAVRIREKGGCAVAAPADVTDPVQRARLIETTITSLGGLDILINNAGVGAMGYFADAGEDRLRRIFEVNFFACTELTRLALPHLQTGKNPMLVNVSSVIGRRAIPGCTEYCASKFALAGWSEGLRAELSPLGIHVLVVCPGVIQTEFKSNLLEDRLRFRWQQHRAMTADRCAQLIVRAMRRRRNELVTTIQGKFLVGLNRVWPRLLDFLLARYAKPQE